MQVQVTQNLNLITEFFLFRARLLMKNAWWSTERRRRKYIVAIRKTKASPTQSSYKDNKQLKNAPNWVFYSASKYDVLKYYVKNNLFVWLRDSRQLNFAPGSPWVLWKRTRGNIRIRNVKNTLGRFIDWVVSFDCMEETV